MNKVNLIGRIAQAVELRQVGEDNQVATLRVAVQRPRRKDGEDAGADFVDVVVWGAQAGACAKYLAKGRQVAVSGRLQHREWDSDSGRRQRLEVVADNFGGVQFLGSSNGNGNGGEPVAAAVGSEGEEV